MSFFTTGNKYEKQERLVSSREDAAIRVVNKLFDSSRAVKKTLAFCQAEDLRPALDMPGYLNKQSQSLDFPTHCGLCFHLAVNDQGTDRPGCPGQYFGASLISECVAQSDLYRLLFSGEIGIAVELIIHILRSKLRY